MYRVFTILQVVCLITALAGCHAASHSIFKEDYPDYTEPTGTGEDARQEFQPGLNTNGKKFTIGLIQSDDYPEYYEVFMAIIEGLKVLGWIADIPDVNKENYQSNREFIQGIQEQSYSKYLKFSPRMFFSFMASPEMAPDSRFQKIMDLAKHEEIDLIILLGTLASKAVLIDTPDYKTPTVMDAVSDPLGSKLVTSIEDSGKDYLTARIDTQQYLRQVRLFYNVIGFKSLGIIYENTDAGRSYGAVDFVEQVAKEKKFRLVSGNNAMAEPKIPEYTQAWEMYLSALDSVCPEVDAMFLGISGGLEPENMPKVVQKLIDYGKPSFAMEGSPAVKRGVMLGVGGREAGLYNAKKIVRILLGVRPRDLDQKFEKEANISINLKTAELMDYQLPVDIIRSADEIYLTIPGVGFD